MKILNINSYYYGSTAHNQLQNIIRTHNTIESYTYVPLIRGFKPRDECRYEYDEHIIVSECFSKIDRWFFHVKHLKILNDIKQWLNLKEFDCMHAHSLFSNGYIAMKIKERFGIPYIVAVRDTDLNIFFKYMIHLRSLGLKILKNADRIIFLSKTYRNYLVHKYIPQKIKEEIYNKSEIIPNGIDNFWLENKGIAKQLVNNKTLKLILVGIICRRKNIGTIIKTTEILRNKGYNAILTIVGKAKNKYIFNKINKYSYVNYIKPVAKEKLINIYNSNDIFVMPSIRETFGLVYAEAMSQGLPVIYTKGQGFDGQFDEGIVGYHVDPFDADEIARRIIDIIEKYSVLSQNCCKLCDKFNWHDIANKYLEIYQEVIKE